MNALLKISCHLVRPALVTLMILHSLCLSGQNSDENSSLLSLGEQLEIIGYDELTIFHDSISLIERPFDIQMDSMIVNACIEFYLDNRSEINPQKRIDVLRFLKNHYLVKQSSNDLIYGEFYSFFIREFRSFYQFDSISYYINLVESHLNKISKPTELYIKNYSEKGRLAFMQNDYEQSQLYLQQALDYLSTHFPENKRQKFFLINGIGIQLRRMKKNKEAISHFKYHLENNLASLNEVKMTGSFYNNIGVNYMELNDYKEALLAYKKSNQYYISEISPEYSEIGTGYDNMAICYNQLIEYDMAEKYAKKALGFIKQVFGENHIEQLYPTSTLTKIYLDKGKLREAVSQSGFGMELLKQKGWSMDDPQGDYPKPLALELLGRRIKAFRLLYFEENDKNYLSKSIEAGRAFVNIYDYIYSNLKDDLSIQIFHEDHMDVFSDCIDNLYLQYKATGDQKHLEDALVLTEQYKSLTLYFSAQKNNLESNDTYIDLNAEYSSINDSINVYKIKQKEAFSETEKLTINQKFIDYKDSMSIWKAKVLSQNPEYAKMLFNINLSPVENIRSKLKIRNQSLVSYYVAETAVYSFVINPDTIVFSKVQCNVDLTHEISQIRSALKSTALDEDMSDSLYVLQTQLYAEKAHQLYNVLVKPIESYFKQDVIIITDKALGFLPFDILLKTKPDLPYQFRDHNYLLKMFSFNYFYSIATWDINVSNEDSLAKQFLGISPDFSKQNFVKNEESNTLNHQRSSIGILNYNAVEIMKAAKYFDNPNVLQKMLQKDFLNSGDKYDIIHLASHSKADYSESSNPYLMLSNENKADDFLFAHQIQQGNIKAQMVVLSACETGTGVIKSGEGIISLARAFILAGCKSVLSTLWSVNDKSTAQVIDLFYENMKNGFSKPTSIQKAKLTFLNSNAHVDVNPFYWGGMICLGDSEALVFSKKRNDNLRIVLGVLVFLSSLLLFIFIRKQKP